MKQIQRWYKGSPLCTNWYNFAVDLLGKSKADIIKSTYGRSGSHECLQKVLGLWFDSTPGHNWQMIIDALTEMEKNHC